MPISNEILAASTLTCFVIEVTPGPNMAYLAVLSAVKGRRAGYAATAGIALGLMIVGFATALGLAALISNSYLGYEVLRWGGVAYLFWLAWMDGKTLPRYLQLIPKQTKPEPSSSRAASL